MEEQGRGNVGQRFAWSSEGPASTVLQPTFTFISALGHVLMKSFGCIVRQLSPEIFLIFPFVAATIQLYTAFIKIPNRKTQLVIVPDYVVVFDSEVLERFCVEILLLIGFFAIRKSSTLPRGCRLPIGRKASSEEHRIGYVWRLGTIGVRLDLLIDLLNGIFRGRKPIVELVYNKNEHVGDTAELSSVIFDLTCTAIDGEVFIIEVQRSGQINLKRRMLYYGSKRIADEAPRESGRNGTMPSPRYISSYWSFSLSTFTVSVS